nr:hypothetical protein [Halomonas elongata]
MPTLVGQALEHATHRRRDVLGNALEAGDGILALQGNAVAGQQEGALTSLVGFIDLAQVVAQVTDGRLDLVELGGIVAPLFAELVERGEVTLDLAGQLVAWRFLQGRSAASSSAGSSG